MNLNILSYIFYLPLIAFIMIKVGWIFYKNGLIFLIDLFNGDTIYAQRVNKLLLVGYYLVNLGYAIFTIALWDHIENIIQLVNSLVFTLGQIIFSLAILHYNNIFWLKYISKTNFLKQ